MAAASVEYKELRFIINEATEVYVLCVAHGDAPITVQGWHHKSFPAENTVIDILKAVFLEGDSPMLWPLQAPP